MSSGLDTRTTATTYDVESLVNMAWRGEIRVPHFQRGFRWSREDVYRLFDSIVKGYPVGSLLLWVRPALAQSIKLGALHIDAPQMDRALWVVDGQQRIISLANALHEEGRSDPRFALAYDLSSRSFVSRPAGENPRVIPLPVLFDLQKVIGWFAKYPEVKEHLDHASGLTKALRQFPVPVNQVDHDDPKILQDIFDRMNNFGKRLSRAEVFTALYAGDGTQRDESLTVGFIARNVDAERQFGVIDDDTVLRAVLARRGPDVTRDIHHEFTDETRTGVIEFPGESSDDAYRLGQEALVRAVRFLQEEAGVPHIGFLPYRFLIVVLTRLFAHHPDLDPRNLRLLRRWFWRAAVAGPYIYRGSATGAMKAMTYRVTPASLTRSVQGLLDAVPESQRQLPFPDVGRFRTNEGAGKIVLCALWSLQPRDLGSGEVIERARLAECIGEGSTAADAVGYVINGRAVPKERRFWAANRILLPTPDGVPPEIDATLSYRPIDLDEPTWAATLASHIVTPEMSARLADGEPMGFLDLRQEAMRRNLQNFLGRMCEWEFEDTPPLSDLVIADDEVDRESDELL